MTEYKVLVLGAGGVGKTCLTVQFVYGHYFPDYGSVIEENFRKQISVDDQPVMLDILDKAQLEEWKPMLNSVMQVSHGFVLVYNIASMSSFKEISQFREQICMAKDSDHFPMILVGNKSDLEDQRVVSTEDGATLANKWNIPFFESSARLRVNVDEMFCEVVRQIHNEQNTQVPTKKNGGAFLSKCAIL